MTEDDKMAVRLAAFLWGASLCIVTIFHVDWARRKREGRVLDCAFNGRACKVMVHKIH